MNTFFVQCKKKELLISLNVTQEEFPQTYALLHSSDEKTKILALKNVKDLLNLEAAGTLSDNTLPVEVSSFDAEQYQKNVGTSEGIEYLLNSVSEKKN